MSRFHFESALEKLARILARQYNIDVVFEGGDAKTDGKKIYLPHFKDLTDELKQDLNGFLDHEVSHCKFTNFEAYKAVKRKFTQTLVNACEDIRIEEAMKKEFVGTKYNIDPLRNKLMDKTKEVWSSEIPMASRLIQNIQWAMEGRETIIDEDIAPYMEAIEHKIQDLKKADSTISIIATCEQIAKLIDEEKEKESDKSEESDEEEKGESGSKSGSKKEEDSDKEAKDSEESESESKEFSEMMSERVGDKKESKFDEHSPDIEDFMNEELKDHVEKEKKDTRRDKEPDYKHDTSGASISIPFTTRFDLVTDHSGKGSPERYQILKRKVKSHVAPIKAQLEKVLKVKENARWRTEREAGKINSRSLAKLGSDKSYRTIFKDYTKTETNNVVVTILVDMSGSMSGRMETAKMTATAMAEALKELNINFEVSGFHSKNHRGVAELAIKEKGKGHYNRTLEHLDLHIFKSFDVASLNGIEKLFVGEQNPDGECVKWAAQRLALRKEKRKILIVLSDGMPATMDSDSRKLQSDLKLKIAQIEKSGIECIGIGIQTDAVKHFYKDYVVVNDISSLPKEAMGKLSKLIGA